MSSSVAISVDNVGKCYHIYSKPRDRLKQFIYPRLQRRLGLQHKKYFREFWALRDISFSVAKGETVGIIGQNGSGKSTLLQLICGTLQYSEGDIQTSGRIAALLELGSCFSPEFTGRENVYVNGSLLGLSRQEIDARLDDILAFADIGEFIDQPVKTYSSGMMVRLAFAVQAQVNPDILIVDEALAVGDARFQAKCFERLKQLKDNGASILLVTHSTEQIVTHCTRAIMLDRGRMIAQGEPGRIVNLYLDALFGKSAPKKDAQGQPDAGSAQEEHGGLSLTGDAFHTRANYNPHEYRWGDNKASILDFSLLAGGEAYPVSIESGSPMVLRFAIGFSEEVASPIFGFTLKTKEGVTLYGSNTELLKVERFSRAGAAGSFALLDVSFDCNLAPGDYFVSVGVASRSGDEITPHDRRYDAIHLYVKPTGTYFGLVDLNLNIALEADQT